MAEFCCIIYSALLKKNGQVRHIIWYLNKRIYLLRFRLLFFFRNESENTHFAFECSILNATCLHFINLQFLLENPTYET